MNVAGLATAANQTLPVSLCKLAARRLMLDWYPAANSLLHLLGLFVKLCG
jgi:hypothetical protein